jgi:bifunctional non-homologous end joining protein LigD
MAARSSSRVPDWVESMLAKADGGRLREGPEWAYEYKLDGTSQVRGSWRAIL